MLPDVPFNLETLGVILPYAVMLSIVGLLESFLTANVVDDLTDSFSDKNREATGQGLANIVSGFFAGMPGCGMIGQTVINIQSGGRTRLSTLSTGVFLMFLTLVMSRWVQQIPMAALVSVMIMVSIGTFNWASITKIRKLPLSETVTMLATMGATLITHNLAIGVMVGITLSTIFFSSKIAQLVFVDKTLSEDALERTYSVAGQIFFVSVPDFIDFFDFKEDIERVTVDLTQAHLWDQSAVEAIDKIVLTFRRNGIETQLIGVNEASATLIDKLAVHDKDPSLQDLSLH
jgi:SulP family sulfate permease